MHVVYLLLLTMEAAGAWVFAPVAGMPTGAHVYAPVNHIPDDAIVKGKANGKGKGLSV